MHRADQITPFYVMDLLAQAQRREANGHDVIHMEVGEPAFPTPEPIVAAAQLALQQQPMGYTPATGLPALRQAIADDYQRQSAVVAVEQIVVTPGASGALQLALQVVADSGDAVLVTDPGYPCNANLARMAGCEVQALAVGADSQYQPTLAHVQAAWQQNTRVLLLAAPANPTGTVPDRDEFNAICAFAAERGGYVILDEIYQGLLYHPETWPTAAAAHDNLIVVNSFSKYFGMTGWRLGWAVLPEALLDRARRCASSLFLAAPTLSQYAALAAFTPECREILEHRRQRFSQRQQQLAIDLADMPLQVASAPVGAFYYYLNCAEVSSDSQQFCELLLEQANVVLTPGRDFGRHAAAQHIRLAFTAEESRLAQAMQRIRDFVNTL